MSLKGTSTNTSDCFTRSEHKAFYLRAEIHLEFSGLLRKICRTKTSLQRYASITYRFMTADRIRDGEDNGFPMQSLFRHSASSSYSHSCLPIISNKHPRVLLQHTQTSVVRSFPSKCVILQKFLRENPPRSTFSYVIIKFLRSYSATFKSRTPLSSPPPPYH